MEEKKFNPNPRELNDQELDCVSGGCTPSQMPECSESTTGSTQPNKPAQLLNHWMPSSDDLGLVNAAGTSTVPTVRVEVLLGRHDTSASKE